MDPGLELASRAGEVSFSKDARCGGCQSRLPGRGRSWAAHVHGAEPAGEEACWPSGPACNPAATCFSSKKMRQLLARKSRTAGVRPSWLCKLREVAWPL